MRNKLFVCPLLVLAVTLSSPALASNPPTSSDRVIEFTGRPHIERGMSRATVCQMFGAPSAQLSPDVWVYFDFQGRRPVELRVNVANPENRDALVIAFTKDRVTLIRACDSAPVRAFLAQQKGDSPTTKVAVR